MGAVKRRRGVLPYAMAITVTLDAEEALVLFEFLSREIDERKGVTLAPALVSPAEFWALNALHCLLEREAIAPFDRDYADSVRAARARLTPEETEIAVACEGRESAVMTIGRN